MSTALPSSRRCLVACRKARGSVRGVAVMSYGDLLSRGVGDGDCDPKAEAA